MDLINASKLENDIEGLRDIHPDLYEALLDYNFLVPEAEDEIAKVKRLIQKIDNNQHYFTLIINPTMNCNFKCWYCYESHIPNSKLSNNSIEKIKKFIAAKVESNKLDYFVLSFFGGEPLLHYQNKVLPIIEYAHTLMEEKGVALFINFTTNGFLINEKMIQDFVKYKINGFQITLDGNKEEHDKVRYVSKTRGSFETIVKNIKLLALQDFKITLRINYTEENLKLLDDIFPYFEDLPKEKKKSRFICKGYSV
jgi:uncharacterized protein